LTEPENVPNSEESSGQQEQRSKPEKYWSGKFIFTNLIILLLATLAGYLQYIAYPALMTSATPPVGSGFGETNVVLTISFLTFQFSATNPNCTNPGCVLKGVPAFDFCQALLYLVILVNLVHFIRLRGK
jgi:hypothetical protein